MVLLKSLILWKSFSTKIFANLMEYLLFVLACHDRLGDKNFCISCVAFLKEHQQTILISVYITLRFIMTTIYVYFSVQL